ncbi:hypothetical protein [uncultured Paludibaculum sp.]|uniref:hypothetical protein n=1 Tax=uncultured Paludibaculum sp. TaxID=1765020 RepID=UPI002AABFD7E|nr:hypothetical protein [uncultured Paludibaculum sp.]
MNPGGDDPPEVRIRRAVRRTPVDPTLHARVRASVERTRRPPCRRPALWLALAAIPALLLMVLNRVEAPLHDLAQLAANQHAACAVARILPVRPLDAAAEPVRARVAEKTPAPFHVLDGHLCRMGGRAFVHVVLGRGNSRISLLMTDLGRGEKVASRWDVPVPRSGYQVSSQTVGRRAVFLVSDLSMEAHEELARAFHGTLSVSLRPGLPMRLAREIYCFAD